MATSMGNIAARLSRIRAENQAARVVDGLGAVNIPYVRRHGASGLGAVFTSGPLAGDQTLLAGCRLEQYDADRARDAKQDAEIKALNARFAALSKRVSAIAAGGTTNPLVRQTLAGRLKNRGFGIKKSGVELGPLEIGKGGIGVNASFLRGAGGKLFKASIAMHVVGGGLETFASTRDMLKELDKKGATGDEKARAVGGNVARVVSQTVVGITGVETLVKGLLRASGMSEADTQKEVDNFYDKIFTTREELERKRAAKQAGIAKAHAQIADAVGAAWDKLDHTLPETFRLSGVSELKRFRSELRKVNAPLIQARADALRNQVSRNAEGN